MADLDDSTCPTACAGYAVHPAEEKYPMQFRRGKAGEGSGLLRNERTIQIEPRCWRLEPSRMLCTVGGLHDFVLRRVRESNHELLREPRV